MIPATASSYEQALADLLAESPRSVEARERNTFDTELQAFAGRVVLVGAGNLGRRVLTRLRKDGAEPLAFTDNNRTAWGKEVEGLRVLAPEEAARQFGQGALFLVTIWNDHHRFLDTRAQFTGLGCARVVPVTSFRWKHHAEFLPFFWEDRPSKVYPQADRLREALSLWSDDYSRREFVGQVRWRCQGDFETLAAPVAEESYFPDDLFALSPEEVFVDCGAFDGVTVRAFLKRQGAAFRQVVAFEPDPTNFDRLSAFAATLLPNVAGKISLLPRAVGADWERVRFDASASEGSCISAAGGIEVECVPLDGLLPGIAPTYLKMDIEGSEYEALLGARQIIARHRPLLAICVYHRQDHVWSVPSLIHSLCPDYRLFLRPHLPDGWQLVCYAVPPERLKAS
jgi:FkbM family methyltransferase